MVEVFEKINSVGAMSPFLWGAVLFHFLMLFNQVIYFISKPKDKERLRFAILIIFYIGYNLITGYFPDHRIHLNFDLQVQIAYSFPIIMSYYLAYYIFKLLNNEKLHTLLIKVPVFTLLIPYIVFFFIPYVLTKNEALASHLIAIVPGGYAIFILIRINQAVSKDYKKQKEKVSHFNLKVISANLGILSHIALAASQFSTDELIEVVLVNSGFIVMTIIFLVILIIDSQNDYNRLLQSENKLLQYNEQLEKNVIRRTKDLELAYEQRAQSFISLAHETRTPLALIKNNLEELIKNNHKLNNTKEIESIRKNIGKLNDQINNIFITEKTINGQSIYHHDKIVDLSNFLDEKTKIFYSYGNKKKIKVVSEIEKGILIQADPDAIDSLINNLLENAIKYTEIEGAIIIKLSAVNKLICLTVRDTGIGIPEKFHSRIFEPYFHLPVEGKNNPGMGIGLSIVKNIVQTLNGKITLQSKVDHGSEFRITLPEYSGQQNTPSEIHPSNQYNEEEQGKKIEDIYIQETLPGILIVEDNHDLLKYLVDQLKDKYNIYVATNGIEALQKIKEITSQVDLVISDVMMDKMDGQKFLIKLKESGFDFIPIIFITAKANAQDRDTMLRLGAIDYIYKPFDINEVKTKVSSIINNVRKQRKLALNSIQDLIADQQKQLINEKPKPKDNFDSNCAIYNITDREKDIIEYARKGMTYKEIGALLFISSKTVDTHLQRIYKKVGVGNKQELFERLYSHD